MLNYPTELFATIIEYAPLPFCLAVVLLIILLLAKSIQKHANYYYWILSIPLLLYILQVLYTGQTGKYIDYNSIPLLNNIMGIYRHMVYLGYPLLIIIMYVGALNSKNKQVRKILNIRKELSIICGFPVLTHSLLRVVHTFPNALQYFTDHSTYMTKNSEWVKSNLGVGISNMGYVLGIVMVVLFLILWITSFTAVHQWLGAKRWKKIQRLAYVLYGTLFIHSITLHIGWIINKETGEGYLLKGIIAILCTTGIFVSYLVLRLRKSKNRILVS